MLYFLRLEVIALVGSLGLFDKAKTSKDQVYRCVEMRHTQRASGFSVHMVHLAHCECVCQIN